MNLSLASVLACVANQLLFNVCSVFSRRRRRRTLSLVSSHRCRVSLVSLDIRSEAASSPIRSRSYPASVPSRFSLIRYRPDDRRPISHQFVRSSTPRRRSRRRATVENGGDARRRRCETDGGRSAVTGAALFLRPLRLFSASGR